MTKGANKITDSKTKHPVKFLLTMARLCLIAIGLFALLVASSANTSACCVVCFNSSGDCYEIESDCSHVCCNCSCENTSMYISNDQNYILVQSGRAWVVTGDKKIPIASNNLASFIVKMNDKYPIGKREDENAQKEISAAFEKFFKKKDDGQVSKSRLELISKETGLRILDSVPGK